MPHKLRKAGSELLEVGDAHFNAKAKEGTLK